MKAAMDYARMFLELGNTASANYFLYRVILYDFWFPPGTPEIESIMDGCGFKDIPAIRHPDPEFVNTGTVQFPELQLRGIWTKLGASLNIRPPGMLNQNAWIWRSRLYVRFGTGLFNQLWCGSLSYHMKGSNLL